MKKKLIELNIGDEIKVFNWKSNAVESATKMRVSCIEKDTERNLVHVQFENNAGRKKRFSFLDGDTMISLWTSDDTEVQVCRCCGK